VSAGHETAMSLADLQTTLRESFVVAAISGEVDMSNAETLGSEVISAIPESARGVVLDLSGVTFLDSVGIYVIYGVRERLQARNQSLALVIPASSPVSTTLHVVGLWAHLQPVETVDKAMATLQAE
jgi:anti-sigma B factor antagonist